MDFVSIRCTTFKNYICSIILLGCCLSILSCGGGGGGDAGAAGGDNSNSQLQPGGSYTLPNDFYGRIYFRERSTFPSGEGGLVRMELPSGLVTVVSHEIKSYFDVSHNESFFSTLGTGGYDIKYWNLSGSKAYETFSTESEHVGLPIRLSGNDQYIASIIGVMRPFPRKVQCSFWSPLESGPPV